MTADPAHRTPAHRTPAHQDPAHQDPAGPDAVLLVAHGSRDPRAAASVATAAAQVRERLPGVRVEVAALDFTPPRPGDALVALADDGVARVTVVPFLLTAAYHVRVDLPAELARARCARPGPAVTTTGALGPDPRLLDACDRRVVEAGAEPGDPRTAVVLAAAGSSDPAAVASVRDVAAAYAARGWARVEAAFASQAGPDPAAAVERLRAGPLTRSDRILLVSYLLAPGRFQDRLAGVAAAAGIVVTAPLAGTPEVADVAAGAARTAGTELGRYSAGFQP